MKLVTEPYNVSLEALPGNGKHVIGQEINGQIAVYQAFNPVTAAFAVENQYFGGPAYSYSRMSWIKPNFLWMMYRCGWCTKENQQRVLAIWIDKTDFENILSQAVHSSFIAAHYETREHWQQELDQKDVRLQWDPDHDPYGNKMERRAVQIGMRGDMLEKFGKKMIRSIKDITDFVTEQKKIVDSRDLSKLIVPRERVVEINKQSSAIIF